ncbi:MAG TPA: patatin-like phospholipase family protein [Holophagaceae bacterium]|nr:patatin-like phospholipase family protein [Holophagaceae bacterium]
MRVRGLGILLTLSVGLSAQSVVLRRFEVQVEPPDMVFRFAPRVWIPGAPRIGLALSGGGARGIAHVGLLQRLEEEGYPITSLTGTSIGALVGSLYAVGYSPREIEALFTRVDFERAFLDTLRRLPGETLDEQEQRSGSPITLDWDTGGWRLTQGVSGVHVQRTLEGLFIRASHFGQGRFDAFRVPLRVVATNLQTGEGRAFAEGELAEAVRASMAVPGGFKPVMIQGQPWVDGALVENLPVGLAKEAFPSDFILALDISSPLGQRQVGNALSIAAQSLDLTVERRQWESRRAADFLIRPALGEVPFTSYIDRLPLLVQEGRAAFDAAKPALDQVLLARLGQTESVDVDHVEAPDLDWSPEAQAVLWTWLQRPPGELKVQELLVGLQQLLVRGLAREASAELRLESGRKVLHLQVAPWPAVKALSLDVPEAWVPQVRAALGDLPLGRPFNPRALGEAVSRLVHTWVAEGHPLMDVRGTGFDAESGTLTVRVSEPRVRSIVVQPAEGRRVNERYLARRMLSLQGRTLELGELQRTVGLMEQRLHLAELRHYLLPVPGDASQVDLLLAPMPQERQRLEFSLGWESTLGGQGALAYRAFGLGTFASEVEVVATRNRLETEVSGTIRGPFQALLGAGLEVEGSSTKRRLEGTEVLGFWPGFLGTLDGDWRTDQAIFRTYARFGASGTGKSSLEGAWRRSYLDWSGQTPEARTDYVLAGSVEWDSFDRHTLPTEGRLFRLHLEGGRSRGLSGDRDFRQGYLRARSLWTLGRRVSLDLDAEFGGSRDVQAYQAWTLGGPGFVIGTAAQSYLSPQFGALRLGLPVRLEGPFGTTLQLGPRVDVARMGAEFHELGGLSSTRVTGAGVHLRTVLLGLTLEAAYGWARTEGLGRTSRTVGSFNFQIGTLPFDLWRRR